jgi:hypothetical protein
LSQSNIYGRLHAMNRSAYRLLVLAFSLVLACSAIAGSCGEFDNQLRRTYGFRPSQLDPHAKDAKSRQMDEVWAAVHAKPGALGPCLKAALSRDTDDGWFLFDGSQLLVSVDESRGSKELLLRGLSRVSLDDVDLRSWVAATCALALEGFDTSPLGTRWLTYPKAEYVLPEHAYRVDRENGAMFIFGTLDERFATPALTKLTRTEKGEVKEIAVWLLMSQATGDALRALHRVDLNGLSTKAVASIQALERKPDLIVPRQSPKTTRAEFLGAFNALLAGDQDPFDRLVAAVPDGERDLVAVVTEADSEILRRVRRHFIAQNTQHAIEYYNQFTQIIMTLVWSADAARGQEAPQSDA